MSIKVREDRWYKTGRGSLHYVYAHVGAVYRGVTKCSGHTAIDPAPSTIRNDYTITGQLVSVCYGVTEDCKENFVHELTEEEVSKIDPKTVEYILERFGVE